MFTSRSGLRMSFLRVPVFGRSSRTNLNVERQATLFKVRWKPHRRNWIGIDYTNPAWRWPGGSRRRRDASTKGMGITQHSHGPEGGLGIVGGWALVHVITFSVQWSVSFAIIIRMDHDGTRL